MLTTKTPVTGKVAVWALPTSDWERKNNPELGVFKYSIRHDGADPYTTGAVKVQDYDVTLNVPAGIDLLQRAVATLMEQKDKVLGEAQRQATEIQSQINSLLLLSGPAPEQDVVEGEVVDVSETQVFDQIPDAPVVDSEVCDWPAPCECAECRHAVSEESLSNAIDILDL